jgi:hypothetical protein
MAEEYKPDQVFLCQACNARYKYGIAFNLIQKSGSGYDPTAFCSATCGNYYVKSHGRLPPVVAEIPLGKPEPCNLLNQYAKKFMNMPGEALISYVEEHFREKDGIDKDEFAAAWVQVMRRVYMVDEVKEEDRQDFITAFAYSASVAIDGLWKAHRGRELTQPEIKEFSKVMFEFFSKIR